MCTNSGLFLVEFTSLASRGCGGSGPSTCILRLCFHYGVSITLQQRLAHAICARNLCLEGAMALVPPPLPRAPLTSSELHIVATFG